MKLNVVLPDGTIDETLMYIGSFNKETVDGIFSMMETCMSEGIGGNLLSDQFVKELWDNFYPDKDKPWWWYKPIRKEILEK